jgi:ArsR family metal-binding transcriptional regulator
MSGDMNETKVVNFAMANKARRKIVNFLENCDRDTEEIEGIIGKGTLDFHLKILQEAGLIELEEKNVKLSKYGKNFLKSKKENVTKEMKDLSQAKLIEITEIRQFLPCIADSSKLRVTANMAPPLGGALKILEPIFPKGNYSTAKDSLIIKSGEIIITIFGSGKVSMRMVKNKDEAREELENLKNIINKTISKGVVPAPREKINVRLMDIYKYLPQTNCGRCGEQGCYSFAIKLMAGQITLEKCTQLKEPRYAYNEEQMQFLAVYF